jgi:hypothetical protein
MSFDNEDQAERFREWRLTCVLTSVAAAASSTAMLN